MDSIIHQAEQILNVSALFPKYRRSQIAASIGAAVKGTCCGG